MRIPLALLLVGIILCALFCGEEQRQQGKERQEGKEGKEGFIDISSYYRPHLRTLRTLFDQVITQMAAYYNRFLRKLKG